MNDKKAQYIIQYKRDNIKRVPLDMQKSFYEDLASAAKRAGESVNGYIKTAIQMRMKKEEQR